MFKRPSKVYHYWLLVALLLIAWATSLAVTSLIVAAAAADDELEAWNQYKRAYNKSYSPEEDAKRYQIFLDNKEYIDSHNTKAQASFKQGLNPLSDLTTEEINASRCGFRLPDSVVYANSSQVMEQLSGALNDSSLANPRGWFEDLLSPTKLDYRDAGRVSRVKDQGSCGSCWAFATTGALEGLLAGRGKSVLLSEQNLVDCSRRYGNNACGGGLMDAALRYVRDHGIMASRDYPYEGRRGECRARRDRIVTRVRGSLMLPRGNEALLRIVLALTGPIPVAIDASARSFHSYKSGIYDDRTCKASNLNHAVLLVGYGTEPAGDYWILKNSWGKGWGDNGYIKIERNSRNLCGVASFAIVPLP